MVVLPDSLYAIPVERIAMMPGQTAAARNVAESNRQLRKTIQRHLFRNITVKAAGQSQLALAEFDGDLPHTIQA